MSDESSQDSEVAKKVPILELNDHCFLQIFENFSLAECEQFGQIPQLVHIARESWARKSNNQWIRIASNYTETFKWRVQNVLDLLVDLDLGYFRNKELKLIEQHQFPNITTFGAMLEKTTKENAITIITKAFPNLVKLSLQCQRANLDLIIEMPKLEELTLHFYEPQIVDFGKIFTKMKLRKFGIGYDRFNIPEYSETDFEAISQNYCLEEISLKPDMLKLVENKLANCRKLKQIECLFSNTQDDNLFESVSEALHEERIVAVIASYMDMNANIWSRMSRFKNLQKIVVRGMFNSVSIDEEAIFRNLREIRFLKGPIIKERPTYKLCNIWHKLFSAPNLKILAMPYNWLFDNIPLNWIAGVLRLRQLIRRTKPLTLQLIMLKDNFMDAKEKRRIELMNKGFEDVLNLECIPYPKEEIILDMYQSLFSYKFILD